MKKVKKWWMMVLCGALLMAALVGVAGARPQAASRTHMINVPPSSFVAENDGVDYTNNGDRLGLSSGGGDCFLATVWFPTKKEVIVEKVRLYGLDNNGSKSVYVGLFRENPATGNAVSMAVVSSSGSSTTDPRRWTTTTITGNPIKRAWAAYLWLCTEHSSNLNSSGVRIWYHTP